MVAVWPDTKTAAPQNRRGKPEALTGAQGRRPASRLDSKTLRLSACVAETGTGFNPFAIGDRSRMVETPWRLHREATKAPVTRSGNRPNLLWSPY